MTTTNLAPAARRLVAYVRVSSAEQVKKGSGLKVQEAECRRWAVDNGYRVVRVHSDEGASGSGDYAARPGLVAVVEEVRAGRVAGVVVQRIDRIARDLIAQEAFLAEVRRAGGRVFSTSEAESTLLDDDSRDPGRTLVRQFMGALSQYERALTRLRLDGGRRAKKAAGGYAGGRPPMGMRAAGGALVADAREHSAIVRAVELRSVGRSWRQVAAILSDEGYRTKDGLERWHPETVRRMVRRVDPDDALRRPWGDTEDAGGTVPSGQ